MLGNIFPLRFEFNRRERSFRKKGLKGEAGGGKNQNTQNHSTGEIPNLNEIL